MAMNLTLKSKTIKNPPPSVTGLGKSGGWVNFDGDRPPTGRRDAHVPHRLSGTAERVTCVRARCHARLQRQESVGVTARPLPWLYERGSPRSSGRRTLSAKRCCSRPVTNDREPTKGCTWPRRVPRRVSLGERAPGTRFLSGLRLGKTVFCENRKERIGFPRTNTAAKQNYVLIHLVREIRQAFGKLEFGRWSRCPLCFAR